MVTWLQGPRVSGGPVHMFEVHGRKGCRVKWLDELKTQAPTQEELEEDDHSFRVTAAGFWVYWELDRLIAIAEELEWSWMVFGHQTCHLCVARKSSGHKATCYYNEEGWGREYP